MLRTVNGSDWSLEFYATGVDTAYTGTRSYWLADGREFGRAVAEVDARPSADAQRVSFEPKPPSAETTWSTSPSPSTTATATTSSAP